MAAPRSLKDQTSLRSFYDCRESIRLTMLNAEIGTNRTQLISEDANTWYLSQTGRTVRRLPLSPRFCLYFCLLLSYLTSASKRCCKGKFWFCCHRWATPTGSAVRSLIKHYQTCTEIESDLVVHVEGLAPVVSCTTNPAIDCQANAITAIEIEHLAPATITTEDMASVRSHASKPSDHNTFVGKNA